MTVPSGVYAGQTIQVQVPSSSPSYASAAVPTANPVSPYAPAPAPSSRRIRVTIPPGVSPGSVMQVMTPEGTKVEVSRMIRNIYLSVSAVHLFFFFIIFLLFFLEQILKFCRRLDGHRLR